MDWSSVPPVLTVFAATAIAFAGGVWALIKWGFGGITDRFDDQNDRMDAIVDLLNVRFDALDQRFDDQKDCMDARFDALDARFDAIDHRFNNQNGRKDARFDAVDHRFEGLDKRVDGIDRRIDEMRLDLRAIVNRVDALATSSTSA